MLPSGRMLTLSDLPSAMRELICGEPQAALAKLVSADDLDPAAGLSIYRNSALVRLESVLQAMFPAVLAPTGLHFVYLAAQRFGRCNLPTQPRPLEYGELFAGFLDTFPGCANRTYLGEVAKVEWLVIRVLRVERGHPILLGTVAELPGDRAALQLKMDRAARYLHCPFPVDVIEQLHQSGVTSEIISVGSEQGRL